jgi:hypothetical protein
VYGGSFYQKGKGTISDSYQKADLCPTESIRTNHLKARVEKVFQLQLKREEQQERYLIDRP